MGEYKKITKEDIDFPRYCFFFIKEIMDSLEEYEIKDVGDELDLEIETPNHPYCYDAFKLIIKTFERKDYRVKFPSFHTDVQDGVKSYNYKWNIKKINYNDLPF